jgi:uncharacterized protein with FMN-binding domain
MVRILLIAIAVISLSGCMNPEINKVRAMSIVDVNISGIPDGKYPGSFSYGKFEYKVETEVAGGKIKNIVMLANRDTKHAKMAEGVLPRIIAAQTPHVDAVSGATTTSKAIMKAVELSLVKK